MKDKYLTVLFSSLILEVVAGVVLLFKSEFLNKKIIPQDFYKAANIETDPAVKRDYDNDLSLFKGLIASGSTYKMNLGKTNNEMLRLSHQVDSLKVYSEGFYPLVSDLERLRKKYGVLINLEWDEKEKDKVYDVLKKIFFRLGRLHSRENSHTVIKQMLATFKNEHGKITADKDDFHRIYRNDIPLFVSEFIEKTYQLKVGIKANSLKPIAPKEESVDSVIVMVTENS